MLLCGCRGVVSPVGRPHEVSNNTLPRLSIIALLLGIRPLKSDGHHSSMALIREIPPSLRHFLRPRQCVVKQSLLFSVSRSAPMATYLSSPPMSHNATSLLNRQASHMSRSKHSTPSWVYPLLGDLPSACTEINLRAPLHRWTSDHRSTMMTHTPPAVVKVEGSTKETESDHGSRLKDQLQSIPQDKKYLCIEGDTPSDAEWKILGSHFASVEYLQLRAGFNEDLNDKGIPLHWPLQKLELSDSVSEVFQSPFVLEGRVPHLSLFFPCGLRFEGLTSHELRNEHSEAIKRGEIEGDFVTVNEGTPNERKVEIIYLPQLVSDHINNIYSDLERGLEEPPPGPFNLRTLEIWENDAIDTFNRMAMSLPHLVDNLRTLRIRSTSGLDFHYTQEHVFRGILPQLKDLQSLILSVGDVFQDPAYLPTIYEIFPPNLTELYFRGPSSLCESTEWSKWVQAFESKDYLPKLQKLALVLDLHYEEEESGRKKEGPAPAALLYRARIACQSIYDAARRRGISVVEMRVEPELALLRPVDERW